MKIPIVKVRKILLLSVLAVFALFFASCNKDIPQAVPIVHPPVNDNETMTIGEMIGSDPDFTIFKAAATRVGVLSQLSDPNKVFTIFLPDDAAFAASNIPSADVIAALPITSVGGIVNYAIVPGEQFPSSDIPNSFPNLPLPSAITLGPLLGAIPLQLSTFPSTRASFFWDNNVPVKTRDLKFKNGVVHVVYGVVAPPSQLLRDALYNNPNLTFFKAAVAKADIGQDGLDKFDSLLNYPVVNMTVLAPNDAAFQSLLYGLIYGALLQQNVPMGIAAAQAAALSSSPDVFTNPALSSVITPDLVRGILAYHLLATPNPNTGKFEPNIRVFSVNFSPGPSFVTTMVNSSYAPHPGILVNATFTGSVVTDLTFTGLGTFPPGGGNFAGPAANIQSGDNHAVNGVYYVIDRVLLPQ